MLSPRVVSPGFGHLLRSTSIWRSTAVRSMPATTEIASDGPQSGVRCQIVPFSKTPRATLSLLRTAQIRCGHTDVRVPDFSEYRRDSTKDKTALATGDVSRRAFTYTMAAAGGAAAAYVAKNVVVDFLSTMGASADVKALSKVEVDISNIVAGKAVTIKWRGKPVFVRHRTENEIARERSIDINTLRDPQDDEARVQRPEWLILLGVCTHLGCVPLSHQGDFGGYFCPCHGSHYDASGRIRKGPAPLNLPVPEHSFPEDNVLVVG